MDNGGENASSISSSTSMKNLNISSTNQSIVRRKRDLVSLSEQSSLPKFNNMNVGLSPNQNLSSLNMMRRQMCNTNYKYTKQNERDDTEVLSSDSNAAINEFNIEAVRSKNKSIRVQDNDIKY